MSTPEPEEVLQHEAETIQVIKPVPVVIDEPARVQLLGAIAASMRSYTVTETAEVILAADPRRKRAVIVAIDQPLYLGPDSALVNGGHGFLLPINILFEITHQDVVWGAVAQVDGSSVVSVLIENWAN